MSVEPWRIDFDAGPGDRCNIDKPTPEIAQRGRKDQQKTRLQHSDSGDKARRGTVRKGIYRQSWLLASLLYHFRR